MSLARNDDGLSWKRTTCRAKQRIALTLALGFLLAAAAGSANAQACTKSWVAPVSGLWTDAARWSPAGVPTAADDVCITVDGTYSVSVRGSQSARTVTVGQAGNAGVQTLAINGIGATGAATLTVGAGLANAGVLELQTLVGTGTSSAHASSLVVTTGTLTNTGTLRTLSDSVNAGRIITANLLNTGSVLIDWPTLFNKANAVYENQGSFTVNAADTLTIQTGAGQIFRQAAGTLTVTGTMTLNGQSFEFNGGNISGRPTIVGGNLRIGDSSMGTGDFSMRGTSTLAGNIAPAQTVRVNGTGATGSATLTAAAGFTNAGVLELQTVITTGTGSAHGANLVVTTGTLTNTGTLRTLSDSVGAGRIITADLLNTGTVLIDWPTLFNKAGAVYENQGSFTVNAADTLSIQTGAGQIFRQAAGTLTVTGTMTLNGQTFEFNGGTVAGRPVIVAGALRFAAGAAGTGDYSMRAASTLAGDIPAGHIVRVNGTGATGSATLTAAAGFTNAGVLELQTVITTGTGSAHGANLVVTTGTLTNTGTLRTLSDSVGAGRIITANLLNTGTVLIDWPTLFNKVGGVYENQGSFTVNAADTLTIQTGAGQIFRQAAGTLTVTGTMTLNGQTFEFNGGTVAGRPLIVAGALRFGAGSGGTGDFSMRAASTLAGDIPAGHTVRVNGVGANGAATLTAATGFTNAGVLELQTLVGTGTSSAHGSNLVVTTGTLTNTGTLRTLSDSVGAGRIITADLTNTGTVQIDTNTTFSKLNGAYVNGNLISLGSTRTLTINGNNQTFTTTGQITGGGNLNFTSITMFASGSIAANMNLTSVNTHIGTSPGTLNVTGNYRMITGGTLNIELGGAAPGTGHDRLNVTGTATFLGTLAVSVINNFCPSGDFTIATYAARVGDFTTKTGLVLADGRLMTATAGATAYLISAPGTCTANTATTLAATPNPSVFGQPVIFTATVTSGGSAVTAGSVSFKEGATLLGGSTLDASGQTSFSTSFLNVGSHAITAHYSGSTGFSSSSGTVTQTVNKANSATTVMSSVNPSVFGNPVTFTATVVAVAPGAGIPTGTASFKDGAATLGTGTLSGGVATFTTSTLSAGPHSITAEYSGDGSFNPSASGLTQMVNTAAKAVIAVTNRNDGTVSLIEAETNLVVSTVEVGHKPVAATFFDVTSGAFELPAKLYVAERRTDETGNDSDEDEVRDGGNGATQVLAGPASPTESNAFNFTPGADIQAGNRPEGLALTPDGSRLWVVNRNDDSISVVDRATDTMIATVALALVESSKGKGKDKTSEIGRKPMGVIFSPDGKYAYVVGRNSNNLIVLDAATPAILAHIEVGNKPVALAVSPDGTKVYAANRNGNDVAVVDVTTPTAPALLALIPAGEKPEGLALLNDGTKLYVTSSTTNSVWVFDALPGAPYASLRSTVAVGSGPYGIAVTRPGSFASGDFVYVANRENDTVSVIDAATDGVIATVSVGKGPTGVAAGLLPTAP